MPPPLMSIDAGDRVTRELRAGAVPGFMGAFVLLDGASKGRRRGEARGEKLFSQKTVLVSDSTYPCHSVSQWVSESLIVSDLEL